MAYDPVGTVTIKALLDQMAGGEFAALDPVADTVISWSRSFRKIR